MISVVVPVYNIAGYINRCVQSLQNQTYRMLEIILSDDGSADRSAEVVDEAAASGANVIVIHKRNAGVTMARLHGIRLAQGENIGFCDGDDEIEPDMYERLLQNKIRYQADISHCGHKVVHVDGREEYFYNTGRFAKQNREEGLKDLLAGSFEPGLCSKLYSRILLHSLLHSGRMDCGIKNYEDLLMNYYLFRMADTTVFEDFCPYHYMKREGSASRTRLNAHTIFDPIRVKQIIRSDCAHTNEESAAQKALMMTCFHKLNELVAKDRQDYVNEIQAIRDEMKAHIRSVPLLGGKYAMLYMMSIYVPQTYRILYKKFG